MDNEDPSIYISKMDETAPPAIEAHSPEGPVKRKRRPEINKRQTHKSSPSSKLGSFSFWNILRAATLRLPLAAAAPVASNSSTDSSSVFKSFSAGTQDLAALVGLFTTDSVERHMVDFYKGSICAAVSTLSLLGMLGWTRGMLKLALGAANCEIVGFPTTFLRTMTGVSSSDRLPAEDITKVLYVHCRRTAETVTWKLADVNLHTPESFPVSSAVEDLLKSDCSFLESRNNQSQLLLVQDTLRSRKISGYLFLIVTSVSAGLSTFTFYPFTDGSNWTRYTASGGLCTCLVATSLIWNLIFEKKYIQENNRVKSSGRLQNRWVKAPEEFGLFKIGPNRIFFTCSPILGGRLVFLRTLTALFSLGSVVGYLCQYLQVRTMSVQDSGKWLGLQGGLALIRLIIWILYPYLATSPNSQHSRYDLSRMPPVETEEIFQPGRSAKLRDPGVWNCSIEAEFVTSWFDPRYVRSSAKYDDEGEAVFPKDVPLCIPTWVVVHLGKKRLDFRKSLDPFYRARRGERDTLIHACFESKIFWDMPSDLFFNWLLLRNLDESYSSLVERDLLPPAPFDFTPSSKWSCRVIQADDYIYLWPCIRDSLAIYKDNNESVFDALVFSYEGQESPLNLFAAGSDSSYDLYSFEKHVLFIAADELHSETTQIESPNPRREQIFFSSDLGSPDLRLTRLDLTIWEMGMIKPSLDYMLKLLENVVEQIDGPALEPIEATRQSDNGYGASFG